MRIGVHTGEIEQRGDDIAGIAVVIAKRVEAVAQPGAILVTRTVVDLVAGSGIEFTDYGVHELKGVPQDWQLYVTRAPRPSDPVGDSSPIASSMLSVG